MQGSVIEDTYEDPLIGQVLGEQYEIEYEIGHGGFGTVYRARQLAVDRDVAVKVLELPVGLRREHHAMLVARFRREAQATSALKHPNTVTLIDFGQDQTGVLFLVLELLEGLDLKSLILGESPFESQRVAHIASQICGSLSDAHARGFVHRDLKPANVFVSNFQGAQDFVKVLDFGITRMLDPGDDDEVTEITMEGMRIGTPRYMAPEQLRGEHVGPSTDLYALGCIIFEMLTGRKIYEGPGTVQNAIAHISAPPPKVELASLTRDETEHWNALLARLLSRRSETRLQTADEAAALLKPLLQGDPGPLPDIATLSLMAEDIIEASPSLPSSPPPTPKPSSTSSSGGVDTTDIAPAPGDSGREWTSPGILIALVAIALLLAAILFSGGDPAAPQGEPAISSVADPQGAPSIGTHHASLAASLERLGEPRTPDACKTSDPAVVQTLVQAASLLESGEPLKAIALFESAPTSAASSAERWSLAASARLAHSRMVAETVPGKSSDAASCEAALHEAARASELCPTMAAPHMTVARVHTHRAALTEVPQATAAYDEALKHLTDQPEQRAAALFNQAQLWKRGQPELSIKKLDELLSFLPEYRGARWLRGEALLGLARIDKGPGRLERAKGAVADLERARERDPDEPGLLFLLGASLELVGDTERASATFCDLAERGTSRVHQGAKKRCASLSLKSP